jgi:hypothetical protein
MTSDDVDLSNFIFEGGRGHFLTAQISCLRHHYILLSYNYGNCLKRSPAVHMKFLVLLEKQMAFTNLKAILLVSIYNSVNELRYCSSYTDQ